MALKKPHLILDVGPLLDDQWTGIPVFTRRLAQALLRDGRLDVQFSIDQVRIPSSDVLAAIQTASGAALRDALNRATTGSGSSVRIR